MRFLCTLVFSLAGLGWLVPNHYLPWTAAWSDGISIAWLVAAGLLACHEVKEKNIKTSIEVTLLLAVAVLVIGAQTALGKIIFAGDGVMAVAYVAVFGGAIFLGGLLGNSERGEIISDWMILGWLLAALVSVFLALNQWLGLYELGIFSAELAPSGRPFANVAQPNNFCTISFIGICSLLLINERRPLSGLTLNFSLGILVLGMAASQSRTGVLQMLFLLIAVTWFLKLKNFEKSSRAIWGGVVWFFFLHFLWQKISLLLLLPVFKTGERQLGEDVRFSYWREMLDAVAQQPFWGYGWQQIGMAQQNLSAVGLYFEHSHNLLLDIFLWNGVPIAGVMIFLLGHWGVTRFFAIQKNKNASLFLLLGGVFIHGMFEYPLEYAYILIPFGVSVGIIEVSVNGGKISISRQIYQLMILMAVPLFFWIFSEYIKMEEGFRNLRLESAKIGVAGIVTPPPQSLVLSQLSAYQKFAGKEAIAGMSSADLGEMSDVARRFAYPPVLFRYALALGLNGYSVESLSNLRKICNLHGAERCEEARKNWRALQENFPSLKTVAF